MDSSINLSEILASHAKWLADTATGDRANLSGANLSRADLSGADLSRADLSGANLSRADLSGANLSRANLSGADLSGADLSRADLSWANLSGADLSWADLSRADLSRANLSGANLSWAVGLAVAVDAPQRLQAAIAAALQPNALEMDRWHTCETTHCLGGTAIHQAGELGRLLEAVAGPNLAALMLLGPEAHAHFFDSNEDVIKWMRSVMQSPA
jgi:hypothetical protein